MIWRNAREANDFPALAPKLAELLQLTREAAAAKAEHLSSPSAGSVINSCRMRRKVDICCARAGAPPSGIIVA